MIILRGGLKDDNASVDTPDPLSMAVKKCSGIDWRAVGDFGGSMSPQRSGSLSVKQVVTVLHEQQINA